MVSFPYHFTILMIFFFFYFLQKYENHRGFLLNKLILFIRYVIYNSVSINICILKKRYISLGQFQITKTLKLNQDEINL